jgi:dsRNA-specific ribonuclease
MKTYAKLTYKKKDRCNIFFLQNITQRADVLEALIGAIFFDSGYSLTVVWDVIDRLVRQYTGKTMY